MRGGGGVTAKKEATPLRATKTARLPACTRAEPRFITDFCNRLWHITIRHGEVELAMRFENQSAWAEVAVFPFGS